MNPVCTEGEFLPSGGGVVGRVDEVRGMSSVKDLVSAGFHLPRDEHGRLLRRVARWLRPGGGLLANLGTTGGDAFIEDWHGVPMYWSSWDQRTNRRLLEAAGLDILVDSVETAVEDGEPVTFQWLVARKPRD